MFLKATGFTGCGKTNSLKGTAFRPSEPRTLSPGLGPTLVGPARPQACGKGKNGDSERSVRCAFLSSPRAVTAVCSVKSRRDGLIIAQHAVLGCEECVD